MKFDFQPKVGIMPRFIIFQGMVQAGLSENASWWGWISIVNKVNRHQKIPRVRFCMFPLSHNRDVLREIVSRKINTSWPLRGTTRVD